MAEHNLFELAANKVRYVDNQISKQTLILKVCLSLLLPLNSEQITQTKTPIRLICDIVQVFFCPKRSHNLFQSLTVAVH